MRTRHSIAIFRILCDFRPFRSATNPTPQESCSKSESYSPLFIEIQNAMFKNYEVYKFITYILNFSNFFNRFFLNLRGADNVGENAGGGHIRARARAFDDERQIRIPIGIEQNRVVFTRKI